MKYLTGHLKDDVAAVKDILPQDDVLVFSFETKGNTPCAVVYTDGLCNKELIGAQIVRPLTAYAGKTDGRGVRQAIAVPEVKESREIPDAVEHILDGDVLLFIDGETVALAIGLKMVPVRAIAEPPTDIAVKGPRQGFTEDIKTNMTLVRLRLKTPKLKMTLFTIGRQSKTKVCVFYLEGIAADGLAEKAIEKIKSVETDIAPDSSYVAKIMSERPGSLFKQTGNTEKPDIFAAQLAEGRVGVLVDGSPIALTAPYMLMQDFQASEDYFVNPYRATLTRFIRYAALFAALYLPAFYVAAQLFKIQLIPFNLLLTIASGLQNTPFSPSLEMFLVLFVLEVLNEASIRMPKYVGLALSVVGALVLGDTAVSAGIVSTTSIIIVAFSGILLYTVPDLVETTSVLRWLLLLVAGSIGPYGILLFTAYVLYYLFSDDGYSVPLLAPFAPMIGRDLKDSAVKFRLFALDKRPAALQSENTTRIGKDEQDR